MDKLFYVKFIKFVEKIYTMTFSEFNQTLEESIPPKGISEILKALWYDAKGDWESAHDIAQSWEGVQSYDQLHAYLHRKEGDNWNANYWYRRAKTTMPNLSLEEEWSVLVNEELVK
jgi:hypothetical protein